MMSICITFCRRFCFWLQSWMSSSAIRGLNTIRNSPKGQWRAKAGFRMFSTRSWFSNLITVSSWRLDTVNPLAFELKDTSCSKGGTKAFEAKFWGLASWEKPSGENRPWNNQTVNNFKRWSKKTTQCSSQFTPKPTASPNFSARTNLPSFCTVWSHPTRSSSSTRTFLRHWVLTNAYTKNIRNSWKSSKGRGGAGWMKGRLEEILGFWKE